MAINYILTKQAVEINKKMMKYRIEPELIKLMENANKDMEKILNREPSGTALKIRYTGKI